MRSSLAHASTPAAAVADCLLAPSCIPRTLPEDADVAPGEDSVEADWGALKVDDEGSVGVNAEVEPLNVGGGGAEVGRTDVEVVDIVFWRSPETS